MYVRVNNAEAVRWFQLAATQGHAGAQNNLGLMYADGRGVQADDAEAVRWFRLAAKQGHAGAQNILSLIYKVGIKSRGVEARMEPGADRDLVRCLVGLLRLERDRPPEFQDGDDAVREGARRVRELEAWLRDRAPDTWAALVGEGRRRQHSLVEPVRRTGLSYLDAAGDPVRNAAVFLRAIFDATATVARGGARSGRIVCGEVRYPG